ncbi:MAG TPA: HAT repeat-containing protein, partial [Polyangiaceae bacterium]|nr:HAT repeat-containing protein [Polyangiaceae bacterium]
MTSRSLLIGLVLLACAVMIGLSRPRLVEWLSQAKETSDVYVLPPPTVLARASLGYRAAVADYLWAHVLVTQGLRMGAKRPFQEVGQYLDAINHLDPAYREPYRLADSLLSHQAGDSDRAQSVRRARQILERGLIQFPYDAELWLNYGQFLAYIGP